LLKVKILDNELTRRRKALQDIMIQNNVDAVILQQFGPPYYGGYVRYFTNIVTIGEPLTAIITNDLKVAIITHRPPPKPEIWELYKVDEWMGAELNPTGKHIFGAEILIQFIKKNHFHTIGIVGLSSFSAEFYDYFTKKFSKVFDLSDAVDRLMSIKSDFEKDLIRKAAWICDEGIKAGIDHVKPGVKEYEVVAAISKRVIELGCESQLIGIGSAPPNKPAYITVSFDRMNREIKENDAVTILVECSGPGGYFTEVARQVVLGSENRRMSSFFDQLLEITKELSNNFCPGSLPNELFKSYKKLAGNLATITGYGIGHNQGLRIIERPVILETESINFEKNMNIALHPSLDDGTTYVWLSDNYLINDSGPERLHRTPQQLFFK